jgi:hypothetical protein
LIVIEQLLHIAPMADRDACASDLARGHRCVGVIAVLRRQIERDRETPLPFLEIPEEAAIRIPRVAKAGIGADNPGLTGTVGAGCADTRLVRHFLLRVLRATPPRLHPARPQFKA